MIGAQGNIIKVDYFEDKNWNLTKALKFYTQTK